jgi:ornithine cyclodeaminase/alanine dehydrogenase
MQPPEILYLTRSEVIEAAPTPAESVQLAEQVLREHGEGQVENPPKPGLHPLPGTFIHAMPGLLRRTPRVGLKWVSGFFENPRRGLPSISGLLVLNDPETGIPTAVMDCTYVTAARTAAVSGVAARYLARPESEVLGIVGAGVQGRYNLITIKSAVPRLRSVRVFDTASETLQRFAAGMGRHVDCAIEPVGSIEEAIRGADIVITATGQLHEVLFRADWVKAGALVLPVHSFGWERDAIVRSDRFVVDDWAQFKSGLVGPGRFYDSLPEPSAELGEIVAGAKPGRESADERIIDFNRGMAVQDVALGSEILERARARGLGTPLTQLDGKLPYT